MNMIAANNIIKQLPGMGIIKENIDSILETTSAIAYWKDKTGQYRDVNNTFLKKALGTSSYQDVIGKKDRQMMWDKQAPQFEKEDQMIFQSGVSKTFLEIAPIGANKKIERILTNKTPIKTSAGKIIGVFGIAFLLDEAQSILSPITDSDDLHLSQRQMDCLMHLVKGKTIKQIAHSLNLSPKTVEHYLNAIKLKLNAQDRSEVIEKALQLTVIRERL